MKWRNRIKKCIPALVHILKYFCNCYLLGKIHSKSASLEPETRSTIAVTWNDLVSKYLNSNFGKFQVRLSYLLFGATEGRFVAHLCTRRFLYIIIDRVSANK